MTGPRNFPVLPRLRPYSEVREGLLLPNATGRNGSLAAAPTLLEMVRMAASETFDRRFGNPSANVAEADIRLIWAGIENGPYRPEADVQSSVLLAGSPQPLREKRLDLGSNHDACHLNATGGRVRFASRNHRNEMVAIDALAGLVSRPGLTLDYAPMHRASKGVVWNRANATVNLSLGRDNGARSVTCFEVYMARQTMYRSLAVSS
jgi:hypothetical protein